VNVRYKRDFSVLFFAVGALVLLHVLRCGLYIELHDRLHFFFSTLFLSRLKNKPLPPRLGEHRREREREREKEEPSACAAGLCPKRILIALRSNCMCCLCVCM